MSISSVSKDEPGTILVSLADQVDRDSWPVANASVSLYRCEFANETDGEEFDRDHEAWLRNTRPAPMARQSTDESGRASFGDLEAGQYIVAFDHFPQIDPQRVELQSGNVEEVSFELGLALRVEFRTSDMGHVMGGRVKAGDRVYAVVSCDNFNRLAKNMNMKVHANPTWTAIEDEPLMFTMQVPSAGRFEFKPTLQLEPIEGVVAQIPSQAMVNAAASTNGGFVRINARRVIEADGTTPTPITGHVTTSLTRTETKPTDDLALWTLIRNSTEELSFAKYLAFMNELFDRPGPQQSQNDTGKKMFEKLKHKRFLPFIDSDAYRVLKAATEAFVMVNCGVVDNEKLPFDPGSDNAYLGFRDIPSPDPLHGLRETYDKYRQTDHEGFMLPYLAVIRHKLPDIPIIKSDKNNEDLYYGIIQRKLSAPCMIELMWSYWHEEGMLVQTMNAITNRFQNVRSGPNDPLANLEIDPLRPASNLIWGYTQDEQHRLSVLRRNYEYDHHYGVRLAGKAVQEFRPADSRSKFLEAFHFLLRQCAIFFRQDDDTTVKADAFPVLNALKEVHLILSQGAHNQFGDLPSTARVEMLMQQWLLARPEFREFLPTRIMVAYPEPWMDRVDAMKKLQGWGDTSVIHFRHLAIFGEQVLLGIRYGNWSAEYDSLSAFNWARFWRPQIQGYIHSYRAATGLDLAANERDASAEGTLPSVLLRQRLEQQRRNA